MKEEYDIQLITDFGVLSSFNCGISTMDEFIHSELEIYTENHYCSSYSVTSKAKKEIVAVFALAFDSIILDEDDFMDMDEGMSETGRPKVNEQYRISFESKYVYPALEIAYLAVRKDCQSKHLGRAIIEEIASYAKRQTLAGCVFLTVKAYHTKAYSSLEFYHKCHFARLTPVPRGYVWPMFRTLWSDE